MSALAFLGIEPNPLLTPPDFSEVQFASQETQNVPACALHSHKLQTLNNKARSTEEDQNNCARYISELVDSIYGMLEALASLHARCQHHHEISRFATVKEKKDARSEFIGLGEGINIDNINIEALAPLTAFLCAGLKGLLIYPRSPQRFTQVKLAHLIQVSNTLQKDEIIEERVWKRTQSLILELIRDAMFPEGIPEI